MTLSQDQKMAALVVPVLLFGVLGAGTAHAQYGGFPARNLTEEQQEAVAEARELRQAGDFEAAEGVLEDAGIERMVKGRGRGGVYSAEREAMRDAVDADDYDAFVAATENAPFADMVDEEFFDTLVKAHDLRESGDYEGARELLASYGGPGFGMGMHKMSKGNGMMRGGDCPLDEDDE